MTYLDWAATALPDPDVFLKMREQEALFFANPSSIHSPGKAARESLEKSRNEIALILRVNAEEIVFTSGGTESNNMIFWSVLTRPKNAAARSPLKIITSGIEHPSVYEPAQRLAAMGINVTFVNPDANGIIDPVRLASEIDEQTVCVSVMMVNNETGAVQPVREIADAVRKARAGNSRKIIFHVDAVQAFGKVPFFPAELGIDAATLSCHKLGGPKATGALYLGPAMKYEFLYKGGEQEFGKRPGTENPAGCFGFALAATRRTSSLGEDRVRAAGLADRLITRLGNIAGVRFIPDERARSADRHAIYSPFIIKVAFPPVPGEVLVRILDQASIAVSTGAACASRKQRDKHRVLLNMGTPLAIASSSIRISTGCSTTEADIDALCDAIEREVPPILGRR